MKAAKLFSFQKHKLCCVLHPKLKDSEVRRAKEKTIAQQSLTDRKFSDIFARLIRKRFRVEKCFAVSQSSLSIWDSRVSYLSFSLQSLLQWRSLSLQAIAVLAVQLGRYWALFKQRHALPAFLGRKLFAKSWWMPCKCLTEGALLGRIACKTV